MHTTAGSPRQVLIFDADDTLWENNILFERVIDNYLDWVAHPTLDRTQIRAILNDVEAANAITHGYGSKMFLRSLGETLERLYARSATEAELRHIDTLAVALLEDRMELVPGVVETLTALGARHDLMLLTKGDTEEQQRKIDASALAHHFRSTHIVPEKGVDVYVDLMREHALAPETTWMIGNSPKSDILPARGAGLGAVFIPNAHTWVLEQSELDPHDERVLTLAAFPDLLRHF
ncbi:HAD family hydrolase [Embleya sp. NPDC059237]|uniref:HAD family hydrolase n=1 Tax=Embleya sp. NPDC059237 TaxID=3346784 RepID=UPI00369CC35E